MEGCPKPSSSVLKNNMFHCGQGCLKPSSIFKNRIFHCGHGQILCPSFRGPFKLLKPFGGSWCLLGASWASLALLVYNGGARKTIHSSKKKTFFIGWYGPLAPGPSLNPGPSRPCWSALKGLAQGPLVGGALLGSGGSWSGGSKPLGGGVLAPRSWPGPLAWGGSGHPWLGGPLLLAPRNEQPACLNPWPASCSRNPATTSQGPPGRGARQTLPAIPEPSTDVVVKKADVRWPVQDRR